jgi:hypothetical protein
MSCESEQRFLLPALHRLRRLTSPESVHEEVSLPSRLWDPILLRATHNDVDCTLEVDVVTDGNEHRADSRLCAKGSADDFIAIKKRGGTPCRSFWFLEPPDQKRFRAPNRRKVNKNSKVTRDPKPARMGKALAINEDEIGRDRKLLPRFEECRRFAEGEKARNVRKADASRRRGPIHRQKVGELKNDNAGEDNVRSFVERDVAPRYVAWHDVKLLDDDSRGEIPLDLDRFLRRDVPSMELLNAQHRPIPAVALNGL